MREFNEILEKNFWANLIYQFTEWVQMSGPRIILLLILLFVSIKLFKLLSNRIKKIILDKNSKRYADNAIENERRINTLMGIFQQFGHIMIWGIILMMLLKEFGIDIGPILASAGIIGLAVGFGAQELVRDFISGFFILLEDQVRVGDVAIINGTGGAVEKIELRTITLRDFSGVVHIFQNGKINTLANMTKEWSAMVFEIGVAYKEDIDTVIRVMEEVGNGMQKDENIKNKILEPIEVVGVENFADSAIVIKARLKTKPLEQWSMGREYRRRLKIAFDKNGIEIPFPQRTIHWPIQSTMEFNLAEEKE